MVIIVEIYGALQIFIANNYALLFESTLVATNSACLKGSELMPKQTDPIRTRLAVEDRVRFEQICRAEGVTETELARRALLAFIDAYDKGAQASARDRLAEVLAASEEARRKDTDRLAKMMARLTIDVGIINQVFYKRAAKEDREKLWESARTASIARLTHKRKGGDEEATDVLKSD